jgi:hypothetical protein
LLLLILIIFALHTLSPFPSPLARLSFISIASHGIVSLIIMEYEKLTVANLRSILKERGIASTGLTRKAQIIEKLREVDAEAEKSAAPVEEDVQEDAAEDGIEETQAEAAEVVEPEKPALEEIVKQEIIPVQEEPVVEAPVEAPKESSPEPAVPIQDPIPVETQASVEPTQTQPVPTTELDQAQQPVAIQASGTDTAISTQPNSDIESSRKRKRRSASPPMDTQELSKKAKVLEATVQLKEDENTKKQSNGENKLADSSKDASGKADQVAVEMEIDLKVDQEVEPAMHPPTRALYIRNFSRPLQPTALKRHLVSLASPKPTDETIDLLHLDSIRTHAFVTFDSVSSAQRARNGIHGQVWPDERNRKELWADFVPLEKIQGWIETEEQVKGGGLTRWEVAYTKLENGDVETELKDESGSTGGPPSRNPGPSTAKVAEPPAKSSARVDPPISMAPPKAQDPTPASFATLDTLFKSTSASKPMLYYLPVSSSLATSRLDELRACTSKQWPPKSERRVESNRNEDTGDEGEFRRYTFEDGDRLVDGGIHRFGAKAREAERGRLGGRGRGGFVPRGPRGHRGGNRFGGDRLGGGDRRFGGGWR